MPTAANSGRRAAARRPERPAPRKVLAASVVLAADRIAGADYASITALRGDDYVAVAARSDLAEVVDQAQSADEACPCLQALETVLR